MSTTHLWSWDYRQTDPSQASLNVKCSSRRSGFPFNCVEFSMKYHFLTVGKNVGTGRPQLSFWFDFYNFSWQQYDADQWTKSQWFAPRTMLFALRWTSQCGKIQWPRTTTLGYRSYIIFFSYRKIWRQKSNSHITYFTI